MDPREALRLGSELLAKHGLTNWRIDVNHRLARALGRCRYRERMIELGLDYVKLNEVETVRDTILHEIAHALCPDHGHDEVWRAKAIAIGSDGKRCALASEIVIPEPRFVGECSPGCRGVHRRHKLTKVMIAQGYCSLCTGPIYWRDTLGRYEFPKRPTHPEPVKPPATPPSFIVEFLEAGRERFRAVQLTAPSVGEIGMALDAYCRANRIKCMKVKSVKQIAPKEEKA